MAPVARGLAPVGVRSAPETGIRGASDRTPQPVLRLLRSRTGASPLATKVIGRQGKNDHLRVI